MSNLFRLFQSYRSRLTKTTLDERLRWPLQVLWIVPIGICINDYILEINPVNGSSMSPTLSPDFDETGSRDLLAIWKPGVVRNVRRGDIVSFWSPNDPEKLSIKRVIATAGDTVYPRRGIYTKETVPYGHIWVEGDNWRKTKDSNKYGPISKSLVIGKATHIIWPLGRIGSLSSEWQHPRTRVVPGTAEIPSEFVD